MRIPRTTARVLPVRADGAVLLLLERDPARPAAPYWSTIGGAVAPGEGLAEAAVRELHEETGVRAAAEDLTEPFHNRVTEFSWNGVDYLADSTFFALRLLGPVSVSFEHLEPEEVGNVLEARWLAPQEAAADGRLVWPDLPDIMASAVAVLGGEL